MQNYPVGNFESFKKCFRIRSGLPFGQYTHVLMMYNLKQEVEAFDHSKRSGNEIVAIKRIQLY